MSRFPCLQQSRQWLERGVLPGHCPGQVAVGWSGGADSTALLLALANQGHQVRAWHVDHAWHAESAAQAETLRALASAWGIHFSSVRLAAPTGRNREAEARSGRYEAFMALARAQGVADLCLAHHREDQAETVCMRMLQGAGAKGICGMSSVSTYGTLTIYRPLLAVSKHALRASLVSAGVAWLDDASNMDMRLWRNRLRHHYFPALKSAGADPTELYMRWQRQAMIVADRLEDGLKEVGLGSDQGSCWLDWGQWQQLSSELRATLLQRMMRHLFGQACVAGKRHIELVEAWMAKGGVGGVDLSRSRLMRKNGRVLLTKQTG